MPNQIPSAFLVRALARRPSEHCDRCGHRMFVKLASGLCPFCRADRPVRPVAHVWLPVTERQPFAPLLGEHERWRRIDLGRRMRELLARPCRPAHGTS